MTDDEPLELEIQPCKHCEARIWFGRTPAAANMPLEVKPVTAWRVKPRKPGQTQSEVESVKVYLSHWGNCSGADKARRPK